MIRATDRFKANGHRLISARHDATLEITKDAHVTKRGSCIIAVRSEKGAIDLDSEFKRLAKFPETVITLAIRCNGVEDSVVARGSRGLTFTHPTDIVFRKSGFTCGRTVAVYSDKSASLLKRSLIEEIRKEFPVEIALEAVFRAEAVNADGQDGRRE
ncbi:MAG: DUF371 domain-containing protein [Candidatus Brockarchaeota archaeon]|nr:DUF371 domain-containing protein [Candidatus Brockarchaeota archaeon]